MLVPLSWLKEYVDIDGIPLEELAHQITMAGLEVEEVRYVGLPKPDGKIEGHETKVTGLSWDRQKIVVGAILEVMPHPNADRLVLCRLDDGEQEHTVLTGALNLFPYKGRGPLDTPLKVAYAKEGAQIYDGHKPGFELTKLKKTKIRGVESSSMVCSEKELGISDEHEGIMILEEDAPVGMPLADYMGDAVLDIAITPNIARNANVLGVAREVAAIFQRQLHPPNLDFIAEGDPIQGKASIVIQEPELNQRFVLGLIQGVEIKPSPAWVQRRLNKAGMRPINNIVDATNYVMLEIGQPLHAFDYDVLLARAEGNTPTIITRTAQASEKLTTLDGVTHGLPDFTVLVCDTAGSLSIAGVMGGAESEVSENTRNVLLEGANWNFINIRKTLSALNMNSEAAYRFSRGVHPAMAARGVSRGLELMRQWSGGTVSQGLVDEYPLPVEDPAIKITPRDVQRALGIQLSSTEIAHLLERLEFAVEVEGEVVTATVPDHRLDIGAGVVGVADLMEEIARIYGYENIPETRLADPLPPQRGNPSLDLEERVRDLLVNLGLQEVITYRMTSPQAEALRLPPQVEPDQRPHLTLSNPISAERSVMRKSLLASVLEVLERNARLRQRIALFEIGPIFLSSEDGPLPDEVDRLVIVMAGPRALPNWQSSETSPMDFYDLKGVIQALLDGLHISEARYENTQHPSYHPGKSARVLVGDRQLGTFGELHPLVHKQYEFPNGPVLAAGLDMRAIKELIPERYDLKAVPSYPPVLEDLALVVDDELSAERVAQVIAKAGGKMVADIQLFDVYHGEQIGRGKKSLAYSITYQAEDRTLTDEEVAKLRDKIVRRLDKELDAKLRA